MEQVPTALPLSWHPDGTPIFERGDFIRQPRPLLPSDDNSAVMYDELMLPEHKHLRPELRFNLVVLEPSINREANQAWLGKSYPDEKRDFIFGRVIQALDSSCRVILQRWSEPGKVTDFVMLAMQPLQLAIVPPTYECVVLNYSTQTPARFFELQAREEVRNVDTIKAMQGTGYLLLTARELEVNKNYDELPIPRIHPGLTAFRFLQRRPLYEMLTHYPIGFDFIDPPRHDFFAGAV